MAKPYDAALKELIDNNPRDWVRLVGREIGLPETVQVEPIDADLSTVSPQADKLFRISGPVEAILNIEVQSSWAGDLADRSLVYSVLAENRYKLPVYTAMILLHPRAEASAMTGSLTRSYPNNRPYLTFHYSVLRVWEMPAETFLKGGLGTLPLMLLSADAGGNPAAVVKLFQDRVDQIGVDSHARDQVSAAGFILMGLWHDKEFLKRLFQEVSTMRESSTYQMILEEGQVDGLHRSILMVGEQRFGAALPPQQALLESITVFDRLVRMNRRILTAANWDDLLATA